MGQFSSCGLLLYIYAFMSDCAISTVTFVEILLMGLSHYTIWDFSKDFHIFVRGVCIKKVLHLKLISMLK